MLSKGAVRICGPPLLHAQKEEARVAIETDTVRLLPERPARQSLGVERPLLVQVKVSATEKARLVSLAQAQGFESISSYARARLLGQPGPRSAA